MPFFSLQPRLPLIIKTKTLAVLAIAATLLAPGSAHAEITGSWSTSGNSGAAPVLGITVAQSGLLDGSAYTNQNFNTGNYWTNPYGGTVGGGPGLWFTTPADPNATRTVTVTFSKPVDNPILHVNKIGGFGQLSGDIPRSNTSVWTLSGSNSQGGSVSLTRLSGNPAFQVVGNAFRREPSIPNVQNTADCRTDNLGTGCGSVQITGTGITSLTFTVTSDGQIAPGNSRVDGLSMRWSFVGSTIKVKKESKGSTGSFAFQANQSIGSFNLDTSANNPATSAEYRIPDHSQAINITETVPAGMSVTASCADGDNRSVNATVNGGSLSIPANAYGGNQALTCTFINTKQPTIQISKISQGGTGAFNFSGTNGVVSHSITTSSQGTAVAGPVQTLTNAGAATTITEAQNADYVTPSISCSGLGAGGSYSVSGYSVNFDAAATAAGAAISCTYTNVKKASALEVTKVVDKGTTNSLGDVLTYTIKVKNSGNIDQTGIRISDTLPDGTAATLSGPNGDGGTPGTLEIGETWTYTATYKVTQKDLDNGGDLVNRVSVTTNEVTTPATAQAVTKISQQPALQITKSQTSGPNPVTAAGQVIGYTITLRNTGNISQTGINISDTLPNGSAGSLTGPSGDGGTAGTLDVGETWTYTVSYTVTQADINGGKSLVNRVSATSNQVTSPLSDQATTPVQNSPALTVSKSAGTPTNNSVGGKIPYTFTVKNTGNVSVTLLAVEDDKLDAPASCQTTTLEPNDTTTCSGTHTLTQADIDAGKVDNTAKASSQTPNGSTVTSPPANASTPLQRQGKLSIVKTAGTPTGNKVGDTITYSFRIENTGNVTLTNVTVTDTLQDIVLNGGPIPSLAPGAVDTNTFTATYTLKQADVDRGTVTNSATASGKEPGGATVNSSPSSTTAPISAAPKLSLTKKAGTPSGNTVGSTIPYTFTVTNIGNVTVNSIAISDAKIPGVICQTTTLASEASTTCSGTYTLTQADVDAGKVDNSATAKGTGARGGNTTSDPASASTPITAAPSLSFTKTAGTPTGNTAGSTVTYTFTAQNTGNVTLKTIAITDDKLPASPTCQATTLAPGATTTCSGTYTLTQADVNAGEVVNTAKVNAITDQGKSISQSDSAIVRIQHNPSLRLVKTASAASGNTAGSTITYTFTLTNTGNVPLTNVTVTETLAGVVLSGNPIANLAVNETKTVTGTYTLKQEDIERGYVVNSATASGRDPGNNPVDSAQSSTETKLAQTPKLTLQKTAGAPTSNRAGGKITYTFTVKNEGNVQLTNIAIADDELDAPATCQATTLAPGATTTCTGTHTLTQEDVNAGKVDNTARASGQSGNSIVVSDPASASVPIAEQGLLTIKKTAGAPSGNTAGSIIRYSFRVTNTGNVPLSLVSVADSKMSVDISGGPYTLQPGETKDFFADYTLTQADVEAGKVDNTATASGNTPSGKKVTSPPDSVSTPVAAAPKLTLTKTAGAPSAQTAGSTITYTFKVKNEGNVRISSIAVNDPKVAGLTCDATVLDPNQVATCTGTHTITQAEVDAGKVDNSATATGTPSRGGGSVTSNTSSTSTPLTSRPGIDVEKTSSASGNTVGSTITYSFKLTNTGNVTLKNVTLTEQLAGVVLTGGPIASLAPGAVDTTTFKATYTLTQDDVDRGSVKNTVSAAGTTPDDKQVSDSSTVTTNVDPAAKISLIKKAGSPSGNTAGSTINYSFTVKNEGNVTLTNVTLSDALPGIVVTGGPIASLAPGASDSTTFTARYTLTQKDLDAGKVDNKATASAKQPSGPNVSGSSEVSTPVTQTPALTLTKQATSGNPYAAVGDKVIYQYVVKNTGNTTITRAIAVNDDKIATVSCPALPAGGLAPNDTLTCTATYTITQADLDAGTVTNKARASDGTTRSNEATATVTSNPKPSIVIVKKAGTPSGNTVGSTIDYTFTVTNNGNVTLTNVTVMDALPGLVISGGPLASLAPGASDSTTFKARYTLTQDALNRGEVKNSATAAGTPPNGGNPVTSPPSEVTTKVAANPALKVEKRAGSASGNVVGSTIDYTFTITNTGNVELKDVSVTDALPGIVVTGGPIALLKVGQVDATTIKARYTLTQKDIDAGKVDNSATATGTPPGGGTPVTSTASTTSSPIDQKPKLELVKTAKLGDVNGNGIFEPGDTITYTFTVSNTGNVSVNDVLPVDTGPTFNGRPAGGKLGPFSPGAIVIAPGQKGVFTATYTLTQADIDAAGGVANGVANTATARGYFRGGAGSGGTAVDAPQAKATVDLPAAAPSEIAITKQAGLRMIRRGEKAPWIIKVTNKTDRNVVGVNVTDRMPSGFRYVDGSASVDNVAVTPVVNGLNVLFQNIKLGPKQEVVIRLQTLALSSATPGRHTNTAIATGLTGNVLAPPATAAIEIMVEPVFDCGDVIGKVFDDQNRNGYQDEGEPGLPGVRVVTVNGLLITTDKYGRFHVACADMPNNRVGSNFIMKLDPRTLPTGYRLTTENPRVIRLTAGKMSKLNFGATLGRVVRLDLQDNAFAPGGLELKPEWSRGVDKLIDVLRQEQSTLRISYLSGNQDLANRRVNAVEDEINRRWKAIGDQYQLNIETRVETGR